MQRLDTQIDAWKSVQRQLPKCRQQVFDVIARNSDGITSEQIAVTLEWPINSISGRVTELQRLGRIKDSGRRLPTHAGRSAVLWVVA